MDKKFYLYIREGFIEVIDNKASIICDSMEKAEDLDKEEIEKKLKQLDKRIKSSLKGEITPVELTDALKEQKEFEIKQDIILKMENGK